MDSLQRRGCRWEARLRTATLQQVISQIWVIFIFPEPGCKRILICKPDNCLKLPSSCLLFFNYPVVQGFLNWPCHRNHLWALLLKYGFPGLSSGNSVSRIWCQARKSTLLIGALDDSFDLTSLGNGVPTWWFSTMTAY